MTALETARDFGQSKGEHYLTQDEMNRIIEAAELNEVGKIILRLQYGLTNIDQMTHQLTDLFGTNLPAPGEGGSPVS